MGGRRAWRKEQEGGFRVFSGAPLRKFDGEKTQEQVQGRKWGGVGFEGDEGGFATMTKGVQGDNCLGG